MSRLFLIAILAIGSLGVTNCHSPVNARDDRLSACPGFEWLDKADPSRDLHAALQRDDRRFIGVYGLAAYTPGVPEKAGALVKKCGVRYLKGTSDAYKSREHRLANERASEYARKYNEMLYTWLVSW